MASSANSKPFILSSLIWSPSQRLLHTLERGFVLQAPTTQNVLPLSSGGKSERECTAYGCWSLQASKLAVGPQDQHCVRRKCKDWSRCTSSFQVSLFWIDSSPLVMAPEYHFFRITLVILPLLCIFVLFNVAAISQSHYLLKSIAIKNKDSPAELATFQVLSCYIWSVAIGLDDTDTEHSHHHIHSIGYQWSLHTFSKYLLCASTWWSFENMETNETSFCSQEAYGWWKRQV